MKSVFMNERDIQCIEHINRHYQDLVEEVKTVSTFEEFAKGGVLAKAIKMDILQIAENINSLTEEVSVKLSPKDLRGIADVRNHIVHGYVYVDDTIIWYVIQDCLPKLINDINSISESK